MALVLVALAAVLALVGCDQASPSVAPTASPARAAIQIDQDWSATNGAWTFTGRVDPQGDPTDVVLDIGPGTSRQFDTRLPIAQALTAEGPLTITTREIPDIAQICVRFTATNSAGTTSSSPLCFQHDLPTIARGAPTVQIDDQWTVAGGEWTFRAIVDPVGEPTNVVLEIGPGPATAPQYDTTVAVAQAMTEAATLSISTRKIPDSVAICVRFTATNSIGATMSAPLCFPHDVPSGSPGSSTP